MKIKVGDKIKVSNGLEGTVYSSGGWSRGGTRPQVFSSDKYITLLVVVRHSVAPYIIIFT